MNLALQKIDPIPKRPSEIFQVPIKYACPRCLLSDFSCQNQDFRNEPKSTVNDSSLLKHHCYGEHGNRANGENYGAGTVELRVKAGTVILVEIGMVLWR
jgi:hypothetical protein